MSLYEKIAEDYEYLFPSPPEKIQFVDDILAGKNARDILDIGCGTGELTRKIADHNRHLIGIDLNSAMVRKARRESTGITAGQIEFEQADMLEYLNDTETNAYDAVLCMGNTIAYLENVPVLREFLRRIHRILRNEAVVILQLLNYSNPQIRPGFDFPILESSRLKLSRRYRRQSEDGRYVFHTEVVDKYSPKRIRDEHHHMPFLSTDIGRIAKKIGFPEVTTYGGYDKEPAAEESFFHLLILSR